MNKACMKLGTWSAMLGVALLVLGMAGHLTGARVNVSRSIPLGLYWTSSAPVSPGRYVIFCPPQLGVFDEARRRGYIGAGFCPGGYGYMMKKVLGTGNDAVSVAPDGVRVNGRLLARSAPLAADGNGRPMARFQSDQYILSEYQLLLMADANPRSFDARYFGPVQRAQVRAVIVPVLTW
ncbi:MAG: conjugative transfer signal peptidase TraF [Janthinobacterium lividum]|nr:conjugative transfer signal peptidase TraF [Janthinobacterium lividum]